LIEMLDLTEIYRRVVMLERDLSDPIPGVHARIQVTIGLLKEDEANELAAFCARNYPTLREGEIRRRLREGNLCIVARYKGKIVHASWEAFGVHRLEYLRLRVHLAPDEVYGYDMHTAAEFRKQGIGRARAAWSLRYLRNAGYKRLIIDVLPENVASERSILPLGFRRTATLARIIHGPLKITLYRPIRKPSSLGKMENCQV